MRKLEQGFTLIELVVVIVILGILAATALPKFQDLQTEARQAVTDSAAAAFKSAAVITLAKNKGVVPTAAQVIAQTVVEDVTFGDDAASAGTPACPGNVSVYHADDTAVKTEITMDVTVCNG